MANGTVKWFNPRKGFGFIQAEDGSGEVFVHLSALARAGLPSLAEGQKLAYRVEMEDGRNSAVDLELI